MIIFMVLHYCAKLRVLLLLTVRMRTELAACFTAYHTQEEDSKNESKYSINIKSIVTINTSIVFSS